MAVDRAELARQALEGYVHGPAAATDATIRALAATPDPAAVLLVEGVSDQMAVEALAARRGRDLRGARCAVVPTGGASGLRRVLGADVPAGTPVLALCDAAEREIVARGIRSAGREVPVHVCDPDLEAELIRSVGAATVVSVLDAQGDGRSFRTLQRQAAWADEPLGAQLRRFIEAGSRRKLRYARLLTDVAVNTGRTPAVLDAVLDALWAVGTTPPDASGPEGTLR